MATAKSLLYGAMTLMLLSGGAALAYARFTVPIADGDRAIAGGQLDRALAAFSRAEGRREAGQASGMRLLRADFIDWSLAIPVLVALWALGFACVRAVRRRWPTAPRFTALSRRSTLSGAIGVLVCAIAATAGLVFAL